MMECSGQHARCALGCDTQLRPRRRAQIWATRQEFKPRTRRCIRRPSRLSGRWRSLSRIPAPSCWAAMVAVPSRTQTADDTAALSAEAEKLYQAGKFVEAIEIAKRVLAIREKALGPEHPELGTSLSDLALLYYAQGRYAEAEPLVRRTIVILEKALGPEHADVAASLNNLAELYGAMGRYVEAEPLYRRSLSIREKALGSEHPTVASTLNKLGSLYQDQGRYVEAEPLLRRSLAIVEKALG